jgi:hypothetical protein
VSVEALTFPQVDLYTWNLFAPRVGVVYDLAGDGRTVVKAQLRVLLAQPRRRHRAGPPTRTRPPSRRPTVERRQRRPPVAAGRGGRSCGGAPGRRELDPNIKSPYTHEASVWVERQLADALGVRAGFVYKTEDDLICDQLPAGPAVLAFTVPFTFVDIGVDGSAARPTTAS